MVWSIGVCAGEGDIAEGVCVDTYSDCHVYRTIHNDAATKTIVGCAAD